MNSATDLYGRRVIVGKSRNAPSSEWLAIQTIQTSAEGDWHTCYPLTGGATASRMEDLTDVRGATDEEVELALYGNGFNPAAEAIRSLR